MSYLDKFSLKSKICLVTGGAGGIGSVISESFAKQGARVIVHYNHSKEEAESIAKKIKGVAIYADLTDSQQTKKLFDKNPYKLRDIAGLPLISGNQNVITEKPLYDLIKRIFDIIMSIIFLIISIPIFIVTSFLIIIFDSGPIFFRQKRVGHNGKHFSIYKFRTMKNDAEKYAHCPSNDDDPRVTNMGKWLRKYSIDELPQLINVLRGDMSLVGPRPEMPFIVDRYEDYEKRRLHVLPGITGLWQVSPARKSEINDNPEYDLLYIEQRDLSLDILILILTLIFVFRSFTH